MYAFFCRDRVKTRSYFYDKSRKTRAITSSLSASTTYFSRTQTYCSQNDPCRNGDMTMTHVAAPPAVVLATANAEVPRRRRSRAQMKALDLFHKSAARDLCHGAMGPLRKPLCQPLLEFIEFEQWLTKWLQRQPSRAILIVPIMTP